jgi:hypothetical protein
MLIKRKSGDAARTKHQAVAAGLAAGCSTAAPSSASPG